MPEPDIALAVRKVTAKASRRIAVSAFELAGKRRKKVTAVHKANVLRISDALFLREVRAVAKEFPGIAYDEQLVDSMSAMLVRDAARYDVVVTTNMFGDILSDEASELSGSLGLAGKDKANPTSLILSAAMLLEWLSIRHRSDAFARAHHAIDSAVDALLKDPARRTMDLGGSLGTRAFTDALCAQMESGKP